MKPYQIAKFQKVLIDKLEFHDHSQRRITKIFIDQFQAQVQNQNPFNDLTITRNWSKCPSNEHFLKGIPFGQLSL